MTHLCCQHMNSGPLLDLAVSTISSPSSESSSSTSTIGNNKIYTAGVDGSGEYLLFVLLFIYLLFVLLFIYLFIFIYNTLININICIQSNQIPLHNIIRHNN